ncbi:DNA repair protein RecN [Clostridium acetireducens DSM 10703]|uniref:DNA repair protein RecN n=1 Tax=Clostridium acetireducens DSM 10703 TaxID=1121290 RepID=A0A1E8F1U4_9CLOT|nr:DNA repair protein RecN [Clostridium acetireducens]OFI07606.1 DNA repair protein RecN [Clostridium acetireducens DSM 10703]
MLLQLNIKNFALIEELTISFDKGFNVLSGETGAGKSILIDAINYVLGSKFNKDLIRTGEKKTFVEAIFTIENKKTKEVLDNQQIEYEDMVIISRETFQSGKTITKVNGKSILLANLKLISETLVDIHGQHENQNLLNLSNHILYLDYFADKRLHNFLKEYREIYNKLNDIDKKIEEIQGKEGERDKIIDFLKYQINEINNANLKEKEYEELEEKFAVLSNAEKINNTLSSAYEILYNGKQNVPSVYDSIGIIIKDINAIEDSYDKIKEISKFLQSIYYNLEEAIREIRDIKDNVYYDSNELEYINSRIYAIDGLKKKYGKTIIDILKYRDKIENEYNEMLNSVAIVEELKKQRENIIKLIKEKALILHHNRCKAAEELEKRVKKELNYIGLEKSTFKISVDLEEIPNEKGMDKVQFNISTNPGEPLKPLEKIVSGGELSRIMLALKTVFVDKDKIPTVIFDEIDTGISGRVAQSVAEKMYEVSKGHQVFCVTHLPQIACISDNHYLIEKEVENKKTYTKVKPLNEKEKQYEIARMIGGAEVTKLTIAHSKEMIIMSNNKKCEILNK